MKSTVLKADALLLLAAAIWGSGFVAQRLGMDHVRPMTFNGIRYAIGCLVLLPLILKKRPEKNSVCTPPFRLYLIGGGCAGCVLFLAAALQQYGMVYTTAGKAGFITGLYVVLVPILGLLLRRSVHWVTWLGALLAVAGLYLISVDDSFALNPGDGLVLISAVFWAVHVLTIGHLAPRVDPLRLAAAQFAVTAALSLVAAVLTEEIQMESIYAARWAILYSGVFSIGAAFSLQVVAQQKAPPTHAALLLSLEAVFAVLAGWLILSETLEARQGIGCLLMLSGCLSSQIRRTDR